MNHLPMNPPSRGKSVNSFNSSNNSYSLNKSDNNISQLKNDRSSLLNAQPIIEQNEDIIAAIVENLQLGRLDDCAQHYEILQKNLVALTLELDNYPPGEVDLYETTVLSFPDEIVRKDVLDDMLPLSNDRTKNLPVLAAPCIPCNLQKFSSHKCRVEFNHVGISSSYTDIEKEEFLCVSSILAASYIQKSTEIIKGKQGRSHRKWSDSEKFTLLVIVSILGPKYDIAQIALILDGRNEKQVQNCLKTFSNELILNATKGILPPPPDGYQPPTKIAHLFVDPKLKNKNKKDYMMFATSGLAPKQKGEMNWYSLMNMASAGVVQGFTTESGINSTSSNKNQSNDDIMDDNKFENKKNKEPPNLDPWNFNSLSSEGRRNHPPPFAIAGMKRHLEFMNKNNNNDNHNFNTNLNNNINPNENVVNVNYNNQIDNINNNKSNNKSNNKKSNKKVDQIVTDLNVSVKNINNNNNNNNNNNSITNRIPISSQPLNQVTSLVSTSILPLEPPLLSPSSSNLLKKKSVKKIFIDSQPTIQVENNDLNVNTNYSSNNKFKINKTDLSPIMFSNNEDISYLNSNMMYDSSSLMDLGSVMFSSSSLNNMNSLPYDKISEKSNIYTQIENSQLSNQSNIQKITQDSIQNTSSINVSNSTIKIDTNNSNKKGKQKKKTENIKSKASSKSNLNNVLETNSDSNNNNSSIIPLTELDHDSASLFELTDELSFLP